jgi:decaprenylphospho-beta-D-ribofuranose 2-oxidase
MQLGGWGGLAQQPAEVYRPARLRELTDCLRQESPRGMIARGLGRSYGDSASIVGGKVVLTERMNRMLAWDAQQGLLTCEAGVSFADVLTTFVPRGYFLPVTPGTKFVTLGGAIAADVHGKNHHVHGSLGNFVESFDLWTGQNEQLHCSRTENSDVFWATIGGMGLTGFILRATLRLTPIETSRMRVNYQRLANLDELLPLFIERREDATYSVAWVDCLAQGSDLGRSVLIRGEHAREAELVQKNGQSLFDMPRKFPLGVPFNMPGIMLNQYSVKAFNWLYYKTHPTRENTFTPYEPFFYPLDSVQHWNRIYGRRGFVQYQALLPIESSKAGIRRLLEEIAAARTASFLAVLKRTGDADPGMLSFCEPGITLALDLPNTGDSLRELIARLDAIVLEHSGRLYLAKDALSSAATFARMYPRLDEFRQVRSRLDPKGRFVSSQARRLGIVP